jgi:hypothetical protein
MEESAIMPKYYIRCGSLELIYSTNKSPIDAAIAALWETNDHDVLDEHFYIDERGMKNHMSSLPDTTVIKSDKVFKKAGW